MLQGPKAERNVLLRIALLISILNNHPRDDIHVNIRPLNHRLRRGINPYQVRVEAIMRTNIRPAPAPLPAKPPPPPLLLVLIPPVLLLLLLPGAVRPGVSLAHGPADDDGVPVVARRGAHEAEAVQPRGHHVIGRAEEDGGRPQRRVEQAVRGKNRPREGEERDAQVVSQDDGHAPDDERRDADQVDEGVNQEGRVVPGLPRGLALAPGGLGRVKAALGHVAAAALLAPEGEEDDCVEAEGEGYGDYYPEVVGPEAPGVVLGADPALRVGKC